MPRGADPDIELLNAWRTGDAASGQALFQRHFDLLNRFFKSKASHNIEDLVQQAFLACVETKDRFQGDSSFRAYVLGVARNILRNHYRTQRRTQDRFDTSSVSLFDLGIGLCTGVERKQEERLLLEGLRRAPLDDQILLELYYWEGLSGSEIGVVLGARETAIRGRLERAKKRLKRSFAALTDDEGLLQSTRGGLEEWAHSVASLSPQAFIPG